MSTLQQQIRTFSLFLLIPGVVFPQIAISDDLEHNSDFKPFPVYPREAALNCTEGYVDVEYHVSNERNPQHVEILYSTHPDVFNPAVLNMIYKWRIMEQPIGAVVQERIEFDLGAGRCDQKSGK
jgi:TonB family protein